VILKKGDPVRIVDSESIYCTESAVVVDIDALMDEVLVKVVAGPEVWYPESSLEKIAC
jgi:hypothetical protein